MSTAGLDIEKLSSDVNVLELAQQMGLKVVNMSPTRNDEAQSGQFGDGAPKVLKLELQARMRDAEILYGMRAWPVPPFC